MRMSMERKGVALAITSNFLCPKRAVNDQWDFAKKGDLFAPN